MDRHTFTSATLATAVLAAATIFGAGPSGSSPIESAAIPEPPAQARAGLTGSGPGTDRRPAV